MTEVITLGGGCFWCLDAAYRPLHPVLSVECGYTAGHTPFPSYEQVCQGNTGHAEAIRLRWDNEQWTLNEVLDVFFQIHDPTTLNRQGHDRGTQYRSLIGVYSETQYACVLNALQRHQCNWTSPLVTEVVTAAVFYPAEPEHQDYFRKHPEQEYCRLVIAPKIAKIHR